MVVFVAHIKNRLLIATLAGLGVLAALGIVFMRGNLWRPAAVAGQQPAAQVAIVPLQAADRPAMPSPAADAAMQPEPAAPEPAASDAQLDERQRADSAPAPTYEEESAARERAAAHSARSR